MDSISEYEKFADCIIVCPSSKNEYPMIKSLLQIHSEYFRTLLSERWSNGTLQKLTSPISLADKEAWGYVRSFLLKGNSDRLINLAFIPQALNICKVMMIHSLHENIKSYLMNNIPFVLRKCSKDDANLLYDMNIIPFDQMTKYWEFSYYCTDIDPLLLKVQYVLHMRGFYAKTSHNLDHTWPLFSASLSSKNVPLYFQTPKDAESGLLLDFLQSDLLTIDILPRVSLHLQRIYLSRVLPYNSQNHDLKIGIEGILNDGTRANLYSGPFKDLITFDHLPEQYFVSFSLTSTESLFISSCVSKIKIE
jgi:hypothetical protein